MNGEQQPSGERALLEAVLEALTLPFAVEGYDRRILERASLVRVVAREALSEAEARPDAFSWNADWLRRKLREEEARHP